MLILRHLQKRFQHVNQIKNFLLQKQYQKHRESGFCYKIVCFDKRFHPKPVLYRAKDENEDISQKFVEMLEEDIREICKKFDISAKKKEEECEFEKAKICWICRGKLEEKVRDHCHFTGKYRGAAHNKCSLQLKKNRNSHPYSFIIYLDMMRIYL